MMLPDDWPVDLAVSYHAAAVRYGFVPFTCLECGMHGALINDGMHTHGEYVHDDVVYRPSVCVWVDGRLILAPGLSAEDMVWFEHTCA